MGKWFPISPLYQFIHGSFHGIKFQGSIPVRFAFNGLTVLRNPEPSPRIYAAGCPGWKIISLVRYDQETKLANVKFIKYDFASVPSFL
jgi:hypothetical protein